MHMCIYAYIYIYTYMYMYNVIHYNVTYVPYVIVQFSQRRRLSSAAAHFTYEEFARLAETRLARNSLNEIQIIQMTLT